MQSSFVLRRALEVCGEVPRRAAHAELPAMRQPLRTLASDLCARTHSLRSWHITCRHPTRRFHAPFCLPSLIVIQKSLPSQVITSPPITSPVNPSSYCNGARVTCLPCNRCSLQNTSRSRRLFQSPCGTRTVGAISKCFETNNGCRVSK